MRVTAPDLAEVPGAECYMAVDESGVIGRCVFVVSGGRLEVLRLQANGDDLALADGLLRSAMAYAQPRAARVLAPGGQSALLDECVRASGRFDENNEAEISAFLGSCGC